MNKALFPLITAMSLALFLSAACADQDQDADAVAKAAEPATQSTDAAAESLMDKPVDFSSPEKVEETLENILEHDGKTAHNKLKTSLDFLLFYDIGVARNKAKLHAKLNGKTPNQIIAMVKR